MDAHRNSALTTLPCRFCGYFGSKSSKNGIDSPWLMNERYAALVSVGALAPGWSLVCPVEHQLNMGKHYQNSEFWDFTSTVENAVHQKYGDVCLFEHGARFDESPTSCGTGHAHLHLVPLAFSLTVEALRFDQEKHWQPCSMTEIQERSGGREYLFVSDRFKRDQTSGLISILNEGISQFFRRVIANRLGMGEFYDYKRYPMLEVAEASAEQLRTHVSAVA